MFSHGGGVFLVQSEAVLSLGRCSFWGGGVVSLTVCYHLFTRLYVCVCVCTCAHACVCACVLGKEGGGVFTIMIFSWTWICFILGERKEHIGGKEDICGREMVIMCDDLHHVHCSCVE